MIKHILQTNWSMREVMWYNRWYYTETKTRKGENIVVYFNRATEIMGEIARDTIGLGLWMWITYDQ